MAVIECVGCSEKANDEWTVCPSCGANPDTGEQMLTLSTQTVDAPAVAAKGKSVSWGGWALGLVLTSLALTLLPWASPAFPAVGSVLWIGGLIVAIVGVIKPPRALAIIALVLGLLAIPFSLIVAALAQ